MWCDMHMYNKLYGHDPVYSANVQMNFDIHVCYTSGDASHIEYGTHTCLIFSIIQYRLMAINMYKKKLMPSKGMRIVTNAMLPMFTQFMLWPF